MLSWLVFALCIVMVAASVSDYRSMRIGNGLSIAAIVLFVVAIIFSPSAFAGWGTHLVAGVAVLVVTYAMFAVGMIGGGDAKFAAALSLWVGLKGLMAFMFYMALAGGVLGILTLLLRRYKPFTAPREGSWVAVAQAGGNAVPYGIAISIGAVAALYHSGLLTAVYMK